MDRINIACLIDGKTTELQLDKKAMPGEPGPCYMITADGSFKGYIAKEKAGTFKALGALYFTINDLRLIARELQKA